MPIGGVLAAEGAVVPNAVGVDIGCGMTAVRTDLEELTPGELRSVTEALKREIPLGFSHHKKPQSWEGFRKAPKVPVVQQELDSARYQLGTLGGGNHFIELQSGDDGYLWIMVHSGSRNFGYTIAREFDRIARADAKKRGLVLPDSQLSPLYIGSPEAEAYLSAMEFALHFAAASRDHMAQRVISIMKRYRPQMRCTDEVSIHHNYAALETHYGKEVVLHRKGATSARSGERGIIPGSQGTPSYIVEGLGSPESFSSCSHGAGRVMGRKEAQRKLNLKYEQEKLTKSGIVHSLWSVRDLDEAPGAYKDIDRVMAAQRDLVRPLVRLTPLAVVKG